MYGFISFISARTDVNLLLYMMLLDLNHFIFGAGCILCSSSASWRRPPSPWLALTSICSRWSTWLTKPTPPGGWAASVFVQTLVKAAPAAAAARGQPAGTELVLLCRPDSTFIMLTWATWSFCAGPYWMDPSCLKCKSLQCVCVRAPHMCNRWGLLPVVTHWRSLFRVHDVDGMKLPDSFDARQQWPNCPTLQQVRDQGNCGSCWVRWILKGQKHHVGWIFASKSRTYLDFPQAFGAAEAISDRLCIQSGGKVSLEISAEDLLSCCDECGMGWALNRHVLQLNLGLCVYVIVTSLLFLD